MAYQAGHLFYYPDIKLHQGVRDAKARLRPKAVISLRY